MSHVLLFVSVIFFLTYDMYKSSLRHIYDPVLSSLKMKGICLLFVYSILTSFAFQIILVLKSWKLAVAVATYVSICIVYRIPPSFAF
jgi:hypothetical protein